ncbi:DAK2 domain-containing protein [Yimella sp. RIT 621]|uniref:DAK2 domain-containing protein n=1 Tax=Yimella sp. RIT 621 TaxID=2510323 RepID=UPI00101C65D9|nr:DAK2 domain-containing protein [Yimella sp. RIT 621]RYG75753.1 DAK2 domain-containing protein [Yimella sp. RIT 621]
MALETLDLDALRRWVVTARADLATYAERINRLNVFPVPDGDTGTNLLMTVDGAMGSLAFTQPADLVQAARDLAQATLMAARGNSGVIISQVARGVAEVLTESPDQRMTGRQLADALRRAADYAWRSVSIPVEGTILTVASAAADGAAIQASGSLEDVVTGAVRAAEIALVNTTHELPTLKEAGVVDAGGAGFVVLLDSLRRVIEADAGPIKGLGEPPSWLAGEGAIRDSDCESIEGPGYEVMFMLAETDESRVSRLRGVLDRLGDSLVVAGGPDVWSVHVHVDDVAAALNAGADAGRPHRFEVTRFQDEITARHPVPVSTETKTLVVAVADSPGLAELARQDERMVVAGDAGRIARASAVRAVRETGLAEVLLVADGRRSGRTADALEKALRDKDIRVMRPGSTGPTEFLATLTVAHPEQAGAEVIAAVDDALVSLSTGILTIASEEFETPSGTCPKGAVVGRIDGEVIEYGHEALPVAARVVQTLVTEHDCEIVTLVVGEKVPDALADTLRASLRRTHPDIEVTIVQGGGPYVLAVGVE